MIKKRGFVDPCHPLWITASLKERYGAGLTFELSRYIYEPQAVKEKRDCFLVPANALSKDYLSNLFGELQPNQEIAFHSRVLMSDGTILHIPMLDFAGKNVLNNWDIVEGTLIESGRFQSVLDSFRLFDSGRSFHGYSLQLLTQSDWVLYMGTLLLMNLPDGQKVVDSRWVGHRLLSGYSSLRWSCNTAHYKKMPNLINHQPLLKRQPSSADDFASSGQIHFVPHRVKR